METNADSLPQCVADSFKNMHIHKDKYLKYILIV